MKNRVRDGFRKLFNFGNLGLLLALTLTACTGKSGEEKSAKRQLNLAIWGNYFEPGEEKRFEELTGIDVQITNYSSNEELLAKIQAGAGGIDVAVPSDYMVDILIKQGMLFPIEKSQIKHLSEIDPQYLKQAYDPENQFSLPYAWTTTGIAVHRDLFKGDVGSWKKLLESPELKGKVSMLDDTREAFAVALKILGFSVNEKDEAKIVQAKDYLVKIRPQVKAYRSDVIDLILRKEVAAAHAYGTEAVQAWKKSGGKIEYLLPEEGGTFSIDNMVILKSAENVQEAHALIDFFLTPETNVKFVERILAGPVLKKTRDMLPADLKNHPGLFPPTEALKKFERIEDIGEATRVYDRAWTELKSR
ncbi:MAG: spermidine/putrescine ABC transporter substrate-binding protein [Bdellovibrionaceae bacterium]|nr:spermidine/putrescine ABC transporter substrate-binding protein [Pseudobdellovibrionaceae bacterium]